MYTVDHYITKFTKIPDELWGIGQYCQTLEDGRRICCALGHCRPENIPTKESDILGAMFFMRGMHLAFINDGSGKNEKELRYKKLPTPKARVLAALEDLKNGKL